MAKATHRLTMAQALVRHLIAQRTIAHGNEVPLFAGVFAIFGHGNVAGIGEALAAHEDELPTFRAHNEQSMAHTAIAFAKANARRRMMACSTSIGPGATNLVTAAATAHVNRLPVLLLPGDVFASRRPDPVLQQLEDEDDPSLTVNDCLRPVSRYWDRIVRPEQLLRSLPRAIDVLTDAARCGPVTLALPQDVQCEAFDWPEEFFAPRVHKPVSRLPDRAELTHAAKALAQSERPLIIAGGGVHYAEAAEVLARFAEKRGIPVAETQAGKSALLFDHPSNAGGIGVTGTSAANQLAREADLVLAIGTRFSDFTTASRTLFPDAQLIALNTARFDAHKHGAAPLVCDAKLGLELLEGALSSWHAPEVWIDHARELRAAWEREAAEAQESREGLPSDAQVIRVVNEQARANDAIVCAAGGLPGELHKLWRSKGPGDYHLEYGYSCMGYEIAGALGVAMARPDAQVVAIVGDGSYLMLNTAIAESVMLDRKIVVVVLDNRGFGCIHRLQQACGGAPFNNLFQSENDRAPRIDFASHARSLGAGAEHVSSLEELGAALSRARSALQTYVIVIDTDPDASTKAGGAFWDVAIPEVSEREEVQAARRAYEEVLRRGE
jgi:3D-(3,5/4)-trihydroxycyclohexane-1,2-dione acylhydrolase (decyclizing)